MFQYENTSKCLILQLATWHDISISIQYVEDIDVSNDH